MGRKVCCDSCGGRGWKCFLRIKYRCRKCHGFGYLIHHHGVDEPPDVKNKK